MRYTTNIPNYFGILPANVRYDTSLKPMEKILYTEITALSNMKGYCYATNSYFGDLYSVHKNTAGIWINNLEKAGYIESKIIYEKGTKNVKERQLFIINPINENIDTPINENIDTPINENIEENNTSSNRKKDRKIDNSINIALDKISAITDNQLKESFMKSNVKKLVEKLSVEISEKEILETLEKIPNNDYVMGEWRKKYNGNNSQWVSSILKLENFIKISSGHYDKREAVTSVNRSILKIATDEELQKKYNF